MLEVKQLGFVRDGRPILHDISLKLELGRLTALLGPNGAGKSTLLKLATGELAPSSGQVLLDGKALNTYPAQSLARIRAVLPQSSSLALPFLVWQVVEMGRSPWTSARRDQHSRAIDWAIHEAGVQHLAQRAYLELSGGERQRVQLARVLAQLYEPVQAQEPCLLLLDEPVAGLDPAFQLSVLALGARVAAQGATVLAVLHELNLAAQFADDAALLVGGQLRAQGSIHQMLVPELLADVYAVKATLLPHPGLQGRHVVVVE